LDGARDDAEQVPAYGRGGVRLVQTLGHDRGMTGRPGGLGENDGLTEFGQGCVDDL